MLTCGLSRTKLFVILDHFLPFHPPNNLENKNNKKKKKKKYWRCHQFTQVCQKSWSYDLCFVRYRMWHTTFLLFWAIFCFFTLPVTEKIKTSEKWKKTPGDIILLYMCTINEDHMMYGSSNIGYDGQSFLSFWPFFALLPLWQPRKSKFWKNEKNAQRYYHFTILYHKWPSWYYSSWDMERNRQTFFAILDHFLHFTSPLTTQKIKILRKWKKTPDIWSFYTCVP